MGRDCMAICAVLRHEAAVCFRGKWFALACLAAGGLSIAAGVECVQKALYWHGIDQFYLSNFSAFSNWMVVNCNACTLPTVFFYVLPLIALVPFAWSYHSERFSGHDAQLVMRTGRMERMFAKAIVVFASAFAVTVFAHILNFLIVSSCLPLYMSAYEDVNILGIFAEALFSRLFYSAPVLYVAAYSCLNGCLMGCWAVMVLGASLIFKNRVSLMVFPYLLLLAWQYFNVWIYGTTLLYWPSFNIIDDMQGTYYGIRSEPVVIAVEVLFMLVVAVLGCRHLARRDVM